MPDAEPSLNQVVAERLRTRISEEPCSVAGGDKPLRITTSIGVAGIERPHDTPLDVLRRADDALYRAKRNGRNQVVMAAA